MKLNTKRTILVGIAFMTISCFWNFYDFIIPLILKNEFAASEKLTGVIMSFDNILALFMIPLFGSLSDKTVTKYGKRMAYITIGTIFTIIAMMLLSYAAEADHVIIFAIALAVVLISIATYRSPAVALMPDITLKPLRSKGNAIINLMGTIGGIFAYLITAYLNHEKTSSYYPMFLTVGTIMGLGLVLMLLTVKENEWSQEMEDESIRLGIDSSPDDESKNIKTKQKIQLEPAVKRSLIFILCSISLWFMGYNAVMSAFSRYATIQIGLTTKNASLILIIANIGAMISFIPIGIISTKIGRKKMIKIGIVVLTTAFATATFYKGYSIFMYGNFLIAGAAWAAINVNSLPMVLELADKSLVGKYTGYYYTFSMSAQIVTPILSGVLFDITKSTRGTHGYEILFPYAAIFVFLSFLTMSQVKHGDSKII